MGNINLYPRGYMANPVEADSAIRSEYNVVPVAYDQEVIYFYETYVGRLVSLDSWNFESAVMLKAARLFGNFYQWLVLNVAGNDHIYDLSLDFLVDTVNYICGGERSMHIHTWIELLQERPVAVRGCASVHRLHSRIKQTPDQLKNWMSCWLSRPEGFEDMLLTMNLLFGQSKSPLTVKR